MWSGVRCAGVEWRRGVERSGERRRGEEWSKVEWSEGKRTEGAGRSISTDFLAGFT